MLQLELGSTEGYNEETNEFFMTKGKMVFLEHSLLSISKWESRWKKPFLGKGDKTYEETIDYIRCMMVSKNVDDEDYKLITNADIEKVNNYIADSMTATWFSKQNDAPHKREVITSELIYYWMIALQIPFECQKWHLNRLLTLIEVCNRKNSPPKKMGKREALAQRRALNASRKHNAHSHG